MQLFVTGCIVNEPASSASRKQLHILRETLHQLITMETDETEFACLKALALFRPGKSKHRPNERILSSGIVT